MKAAWIFSQLGMGKDVLSDYLVTKLPGWERGSFANAVKNVFCESFGVTREFVEEWKRRSEIPPGMLVPVRQGLQMIGDGFRKIKDDIWIEIALRDENKNLCGSDGRYMNEARAMRAKGGISVVLYRPGFYNDDPNPSEAQIKPIVEWCDNTQRDGPINLDIPISLANQFPHPEGIEYFNFFLRNDGNLEDLYKKVDDLLVPFIKFRYGL